MTPARTENRLDPSPQLKGWLTIRWKCRSRALAADSWSAVEMPLDEGDRGPWAQWGHESPANGACEVEILDGPTVSEGSPPLALPLPA